ncbi:hypothetical protein [Pseudonocardia alaniniphila]|uniref:Circularly permuted ATP-grasp superfamily protein n=1 Tax=Pseudonocardia alaniniphila TaxID=75291 RepID=A0ABS9TNW6_9PSEU|nr:hypothetical protein [Pseudonocardia alaniniphila]MCH6170240.1 hypothetical protein [Pseudonocardia alaniniphila]
MTDTPRLDVPIRDVWDALPEQLRAEFLARRTESTGWNFHRLQESDGKYWEPLRPVVIGERAYRRLDSITARLLYLAVDACRRRASTVGELKRLLRFPDALVLMDPDRPIVATELIRYARPDFLLEQGRPRLLELNTLPNLGRSVTLCPQLADAYAQLCPHSGLYQPPSTVAARSEALVRTLPGEIGNGIPIRLLMPTYKKMKTGAGEAKSHKTARRASVADAERVGFEVVQADLAELRLDTTGRLLAADVPIDVVLLQWGGGIVEDGGGVAALCGADRAQTVGLFPRTESGLVSSKAILAWLHEDCDAGLLAAADQELVREHVPWTACLGLDCDPDEQKELLSIASSRRDQLVAKPASGSSGKGVLFGSQAAEQDWPSALVEEARTNPVVLQERVVSDRTPMQFHELDSGQQVTAEVPFVLSPFMIDGVAGSLYLRHMGPYVAAGDLVIGAFRGAYESTVLLAPEPSVPGAAR